VRLKLGVNPAPECSSVLVMAPEKTRSFVWTDWWRPTAQPFPASIDCKQQRLTRSRLSGRAPTENAACWDYRQAKFKVNGITTRFKLPLGKALPLICHTEERSDEESLVPCVNISRVF